MECVALENQTVISQQLRRLPPPCPCLLTTLQGSAGHLWAKLSVSSGFGKKTDQRGRRAVGYGAAVPLTGGVTQGKAPSLWEPGSLVCKTPGVYVWPEWKHFLRDLGCL